MILRCNHLSDQPLASSSDPEPEPDPVRSAFDGLRRERLNGSESLPTMRTEHRCVDPPIHNVGGASLKLREHHRRASEQRTRRRDVVLEPECDREVKNSDAFHRATTSDLVVPSLDATGRGAESLGGIQNG